jgi:hypothetical protein
MREAQDDNPWSVWPFLRLTQSLDNVTDTLKYNTGLFTLTHFYRG